MAKQRLGNATYVERGYGQLEPNHMSAQRTGQVYAQLPAAANIDLLENGQFVKYNYKDGVCDFSGEGEWMIVFNEIKVYREGESECDFAMIKDNYNARIYSPVDGTLLDQQLTQPRFYGGGTRKDPDGQGGYTTTNIPKVVTKADPYEIDSTENPFAALYDYGGPKAMPEGTKMVPRVLKTNVGDIFTTNTIMATAAPAIGATFKVGANGYLTAGTGTGGIDPTFQVVKNYDLGDRQKAVKLMRIN